MRTGACTVQQALTAEAATVLKHSLSLARRRGHAQVTPLHVAATLLSSSSSSSNLLRSACLKSQPHHPASHPLQCRALELCFNVALNRLPTSPPPSSGPLLHSQPSLSNALIAALKRAQAHQRRGCIELQQQQQQQPLLAIKVELEQLILSILDDPSVSRVMREAGFSSTCVKNNLEEESSVMGQPSTFMVESHKDIISHGSSFWQSHFFKVPPEQNPPLSVNSTQKEDLKVVFEVMLRKQGKRTNTVIVGDSVSMTEGLVAELMGRVERGEVPDELKSAHFINLQLSYVHLRLMSRGDVDLKVSGLRRKLGSLASDRVGGGVIIYAGDLRWAVDEETKDRASFRPVEHMVSELGRLLSEHKTSINNGGCGGAKGNKLWLLATASYQTYMRCQMRQPSLETHWALQAVVVPSGGLALSLQASSGQDSRVSKLGQYPFHLLEPKVTGLKEEEKLICCAECTSNFEKEASVFKLETEDNSGSTQLPSWLRATRPENHSKDALLELKRKWNRQCQSIHQTRHSQTNLPPSFINQSLFGKNSASFSSHSWWSSSLMSHQNKNLIEPHAIYFSRSTPKLADAFTRIVDKRSSMGIWQERDESKQWFSEVNLQSFTVSAKQQVKTTLALGNPFFSDSATSKAQTEDQRGLELQLRDNIAWQSETIPAIVEALDDCRTSKKKGVWLLMHGSDHIAKRRLALVIAETFYGSTDKLIQITAERKKSCSEVLREALGKDPKNLVFIEDFDKMDADFRKFIIDAQRIGSFEDSFGREVNSADAIFILITSGSTKSEEINRSSASVIKMRLCIEDQSSNDLKRKAESELQDNSKKLRTGEKGFDLNICAKGDQDGDDKDDEAVPSDLTHETDISNLNHPNELLESTIQFTLAAGPERCRQMSANLLSQLHRAFDKARSSREVTGHLSVDSAVVEELIEASGFFLESFFEKWLREVFQKNLVSVQDGGNVRLCLEGKEQNAGEFGFMGSVLPKRIQMEGFGRALSLM